MPDDRPAEITIDVSDLRFPSLLQARLALALSFPDFYGHNWNAFWDAITGLVPMPHRLIFTGWADLQSRHPDDAHLLQEILARATRLYPTIAATVEYR